QPKLVGIRAAPVHCRIRNRRVLCFVDQKIQSGTYLCGSAGISDSRGLGVGAIPVSCRNGYDHLLRFRAARYVAVAIRRACRRHARTLSLLLLPIPNLQTQTAYKSASKSVGKIPKD